MGFRDLDLDDQVRAAFRRDGRLSTNRIGIDVRNGIVRLKGSVNAHERAHALELVRGVDSVAAVVDELRII